VVEATYDSDVITFTDFENFGLAIPGCNGVEAQRILAAVGLRVAAGCNREFDRRFIRSLLGGSPYDNNKIN